MSRLFCLLKFIGVLGKFIRKFDESVLSHKETVFLLDFIESNLNCSEPKQADQFSEIRPFSTVQASFFQYITESILYNNALHSFSSYKQIC